MFHPKSYVWATHIIIACFVYILIFYFCSYWRIFCERMMSHVSLPCCLRSGFMLLNIKTIMFSAVCSLFLVPVFKFLKKIITHTVFVSTSVWMHQLFLKRDLHLTGTVENNRNTLGNHMVACILTNINSTFSSHIYP